MDLVDIHTSEVFRSIMVSGWVAVLIAFIDGLQSDRILRRRFQLTAAVLCGLNLLAALLQININTHIGLHIDHFTTQFIVFQFLL